MTDLLSYHKRFQKSENKVYMWKIRFYPSCLYFKLDRWLEKMSSEGWHIVDCGICSFLFEKGTPEKKKYFTYCVGGGHNDDGIYSIPLRYPFLEKTYGVKKKKSAINANLSKTYLILEVDTQRVDTEKDVGYQELVADRNRLYARKTVKTMAIIVLALATYCIARLIVG